MSAPSEEQKHDDAAQQEELDFDTDSVRAPRREFTAEERAAQLLAQQEEDAVIAKEASELLSE